MIKRGLWKIWALQKEMGDLVTQDVEAVEVLMTTLPQSSPASVPGTVTELQKMKSGTGGVKNFPLKEKIRSETI